MIKKIIGALLLSCCGLTVVHAARHLHAAPEQPNHGLLIFLDDHEDGMRAVTSCFMSAFAQQAGPLLVSASVLANIVSNNVVTERNPALLLALQRQVEHDVLSNDTLAAWRRLVQPVAAFVDFNNALTHHWVLKKVNNELYLLLPLHYLQSKKISRSQAEAVAPQGVITQPEQAVGLKINHMQAASVTHIKKPAASPVHAGYFTDALKNIFVTNREYYAQKNKKVPVWTLYGIGHGSMHNSIMHVSLPQFKMFLDFAEHAITTRLVVYTSCYAAGTNAHQLYKDAKSGIAQTYSFAIITMALTDAEVWLGNITLEACNGAYVATSGMDYAGFLQEVIQPGVINYAQAAQKLTSRFMPKQARNVAQIKYAGLPWFSVMDQTNVVAIGSILAKAHTGPLDIATFFGSQKTGPADPYAILVYAHDIPFELVVNTKVGHRKVGQVLVGTKTVWRQQGAPYVPTFVSMVPGDVVHHIKKISSTMNTVEDIMHSFFMVSLASHKIFIIDAIEAPWGAALRAFAGNACGSVADVVIDHMPGQFTVYFVYNGVVYTTHEKDLTLRVANKQQKNSYAALLKKRGSAGADTVVQSAVSAIKLVQEQKLAQGVLTLDEIVQRAKQKAKRDAEEQACLQAEQAERRNKLQAEQVQLRNQQKKITAQLKKKVTPPQRKKLLAQQKQITKRLKQITGQLPVPAQQPVLKKMAHKGLSPQQKKKMQVQRKKLLAQQKQIAAQLKKVKNGAQKNRLRRQQRQVAQRLKQIAAKLKHD